MSTFRIGQGFDVHPFSEDSDRSLIIGGEILPGPGLDGHSDADLLAVSYTHLTLPTKA